MLLSNVVYNGPINYPFTSQVGSRVVIQVLSVYLLFCAFFTKILAFFATIPEPVIGGIFAVTLGEKNCRYVPVISSLNQHSSSSLLISYPSTSCFCYFS